MVQHLFWGGPRLWVGVQFHFLDHFLDATCRRPNREGGATTGAYGGGATGSSDSIPPSTPERGEESGEAMRTGSPGLISRLTFLGHPPGKPKDTGAYQRCNDVAARQRFVKPVRAGTIRDIL